MKTKPTQRRNPADVAVRLVARHLLKGLRKVDWDEWRKSQVEDTKKLEGTIGLLARLSRELRAQDADTAKRAPTLAEIEEIERTLNLL
jgi:hypothetical protein